jgi:predicted dehydrogenase
VLPVHRRVLPLDRQRPRVLDPVQNPEVFDNAFKVQWELFLKHVACNAPFPWTLLEGAKGVQLAELGLRSWRERRWLEAPEVR